MVFCENPDTTEWQGMADILSSLRNFHQQGTEREVKSNGKNRENGIEADDKEILEGDAVGCMSGHHVFIVIFC